ncbi:hypothetical protein [Paenibacillus kribbensis]|uniref:hypothetical protein n=1 Tax=Paenibacillus kribbensis TaxID=172713 RepID=UPI0015C0A6EA|nr:hypothetical protein [Paenibacillus kribbensis]
MGLLTYGEAIYLQADSNSMVMDGETDIRASRVKLDGLTKRPVFIFQGNLGER